MPELPRLYTFATSPFAGKARIALAEKGVEVEYVEVHPRAADRPAELFEHNPFGKVPTLVLPGGEVLRESNVIFEWLEETHPEPRLWPQDPVVRAAGRAWLTWLDGTLSLDYFLGLRQLVFGGDDAAKAKGQKRLDGVPAHWPVLERALAEREGPWVLGEEFSWADLAGMPLAVRLPEWTGHLQPDAGEFPRAAAWLEALRARPTADRVAAAGEKAAA